MAQATSTVILEPAAQEVARMTAQPPFLFQIPPVQGRAKLDEIQSGQISQPDVDLEDMTIPGGPTGQVQVRIVWPKGQQAGGAGGLRNRVRAVAQDVMQPDGSRNPQPVVLFVHGAGWVFGDFHTHERLVRELATQANVAVVFPEYSRAPEAQFPVALEECYTVAQWIMDSGAAQGLDASRMAIAGDSVGGNMATVLTMMAKQRGGPRFLEQVLFYPVTDANFDTASYREFSEGYYLGRELMMWFWDQYLPDTSRRSNPMAAPLQASMDQLKGLPPALIITDEADVLRDEGEAYASKLRQAGVPVTEVRYQGMIHDFVMLNALADSPPARKATSQAAMSLRDTLHKP
ncbi:alpha/beta hydrolase [Micromonospora polyrhachis]|uniref:Acetyl esterase n=1 Tax=Micromonospora polyrhachis TaxID=1282883 RepID=A0A7W7WPF7_9ACTN|nr:alpha/beta hydrolase [Micromonospora polyrhachis]MBB4958517.1 acetyl esterase [Micromonospora polyrhachis]